MLLVASAHARQPKHYASGILVRMDAVECSAEAHGAPLCQQYTVSTDRVIYRIRPTSPNPPVLPVGGIALFRLDGNTMKLRAEDLDDKDREYIVISATARDDSKAAESTLRLNHLQ
jgi:hypothetical protein